MHVSLLKFPGDLSNDTSIYLIPLIVPELTVSKLKPVSGITDRQTYFIYAALNSSLRDFSNDTSSTFVVLIVFELKVEDRHGADIRLPSFCC